VAQPPSNFVAAIQVCDGALEASQAFENDAPGLIDKIREAIVAYDKTVDTWNSIVESDANLKIAAYKVYPHHPITKLGDLNYGTTKGFLPESALPNGWQNTDDVTKANEYVNNLIRPAVGEVEQATYDGYEEAIAARQAGAGTSLQENLNIDAALVYSVNEQIFKSEIFQTLVQAGVAFSSSGLSVVVDYLADKGLGFGVDLSEGAMGLLETFSEFIPTGWFNSDPLYLLANWYAEAPGAEAASNALREAHEGLQDLQRQLKDTMQTYEDAVQQCVNEAGAEGRVGGEIGKAISDACKFASKWIKCPDGAIQTEAEEESGRATQAALVEGGLAGALAAQNFAGARNFKEQCFLLAKIFDLAHYKKTVIETSKPKRLPYVEGSPKDTKLSNACLMADGQPYGFMNKLTQSPSQAEFYDMQTDVISTLMPKIQLFKINLDEHAETGEILESEQEYIFDSNTVKKDIENVFHEKGKRGFGVGIKHFSFTYDGNNPFAAKKSIKAKLTIFANSFDELLRDRGGYSYIELALKTGSGKGVVGDSSLTEEQRKKIRKNQEKLNFRLKAVCGWAMPNGKLTKNATWMVDAVRDSFITINLTPTTHEFDIDQQGRVNFIINYLAYVDDAFDHPKYNIFSNVEVALKTYRRNLRYKTLGTKCKATEVATIKKKELEDGDVINEKQESMMTIMNKLLEIDKMKYINIAYKDILEFQTKGPYAELAGAANVSTLIQDPKSHSTISAQLQQTYTQTLKIAQEQDAEAELKLSMLANNPHMNNIPFFYVSDLIDVILDGIDKNLDKDDGLIKKLADDKAIKDLVKKGEVSQADLDEEIKDLKKYSLNYKKLRILLGPVEIVSPKDRSKSQFVNFGDIPISAKYFTEWMTENLIKKEQTVYPLSRFLNDFFNNLVRNFLNDDNCFGSTGKQRTVLNQAVLTSYKNTDVDDEPKKYDEITEYIISPPGGAYTFKDKKRLSRIILNRPRWDYLPQPLLNIAGSRGTPIANPGQAREVNYLVYFAGRTQPSELMKGEKYDTYYEINDKPYIEPGDQSRGIFHYILGKSQGIVKSIELSKTDAKYLKEVRFEQEGYDGLEQLREVYDVNITTYANVSAFPGAYIYVDPKGFLPNSMIEGQTVDLTQFGIGGYCMIIRNETSFAAGQAETKLTAKWVASIGAEMTSDPVKDEEADPEGSASNNPECNVSARSEAEADVSWLDTVLDWASVDIDSVGLAVEDIMTSLGDAMGGS
tara:strand:+ start:539 stop:4240 length:3702 start_codon:yes stop_codon:yes gene_type:complete